MNELGITLSKWYLLYGGESADGRGEGIYKGRTLDPEVAHTHLLSIVDNPYSIGKVVIVTDDKLKMATLVDFQSASTERTQPSFPNAKSEFDYES